MSRRAPDLDPRVFGRRGLRASPKRAEDPLMGLAPPSELNQAESRRASLSPLSSSPGSFSLENLRETDLSDDAPTTFFLASLANPKILSLPSRTGRIAHSNCGINRSCSEAAESTRLTRRSVSGLDPTHRTVARAAQRRAGVPSEDGGLFSPDIHPCGVRALRSPEVDDKALAY